MCLCVGSMMSSPYTEVSTGHFVHFEGSNFAVVLRPFQDDDKIPLADVGNDLDVAKWMTAMFPHPYTQGDAEYWINWNKELRCAEEERINSIKSNCKTGKESGRFNGHIIAAESSELSSNLRPKLGR